MFHFDQKGEISTNLPLFEMAKQATAVIPLKTMFGTISCLSKASLSIGVEKKPGILRKTLRRNTNIRSST